MALALLATTAVVPAHGHDELPVGDDNGAEGRNPFGSADHVPPAEACADELARTGGSLVIRVLVPGPRREDGSLAFTSGVCVYLPPGYVGGHLAYPVLYLLHGGGSDHAAWVTFGGIRETMDAAVAADPRNAAIVVMPDGQDAQWHDHIDGTFLNERYVLDHLLPYVDGHFRTIAERTGRAIDGLSNGGYGALHLAAKAPDRFVAAGGMSSNLGARSFGGLGNPVESPAYYQGNVPAQLVGNLDGIDVTLDIGASCSSDLSRDLCGTWAFEQLFLLDNRYFVSLLDAARGPGDGIHEYRETEGSHAWRWWSLWLRERHLPFLLARLADPRPAGIPDAPTPPRPGFRYRSIAPAFSVWGYDVDVERHVREFLDLSDVTEHGMTVRGSGTATVTTAPRYKARRPYVVAGTGRRDEVVVADGDGRLRFEVDLGPSHEWEQFSLPATVLEADADYWTVRAVTIRPR